MIVIEEAVVHFCFDSHMRYKGESQGRIRARASFPAGRTAAEMALKAIQDLDCIEEVTVRNGWLTFHVPLGNVPEWQRPSYMNKVREQIAESVRSAAKRFVKQHGAIASDNAQQPNLSLIQGGSKGYTNQPLSRRRHKP